MSIFKNPFQKTSQPPNTYIAIDFETANHNHASACAIGYLIVKDGKVHKKEAHLIKPQPLQFDPSFIKIHNIQPQDVKHAPTFGKLWRKLAPIFSGQTLIAHNAGFDMSVLRKSLDQYNIPYPEINYYCTLTIAKRVWPDLENYQLPTIAKFMGVKLNHHDALSDAGMCAQIAYAACHQHEVSSLDELATQIKIKPGRIYPGGYQATEATRLHWTAKPNLSKLEADADAASPERPFVGKRFVFTGSLDTMTRTEAAQMAVNAGAECANGMSGKVSYLVLGPRAYARLQNGQKSGKIKKAEELAAKGIEIQIISEEEFLKLLN